MEPGDHGGHNSHSWTYSGKTQNWEGMTSGQPCRTGVFREQSEFEEKTPYKQARMI